MRILVLSPTFLPMVGGAEILLLEVYRRIAERHEVCLLTMQKGLPPGDLDRLVNFPVVRYQDRVSIMRLRGHRLSGGILPPFSLSAVRATNRLIADFCPDVLNTHYMAYTGLATVVARRQSGLPAVLSFSGRDVPGPNTPRLWKYYDRWVARQVSDVTYITEYCRHAIWGAKERVGGHIIPGGVDLKRYHPGLDGTSVRQRLGLLPSIPVLFAMQRLWPEKRVDILIRALPDVLREYPRAVLVVGGTGRSMPQLAGLVQELGLERSVRFAGYIPGADLPLYYAMCDLFVFHSTYETFGIVLVEAMAAGKPVVSVRTTAIPEVVHDGETGVLAPPLNPQAMASKILYLLDTPAERERLGHNARAWVERKCDWDLIASQYEAVLEAVSR